MADENNLDIKEMKNRFESSVETVPVMDVVNAEDVISVVSKDQEEIILEVVEVPKPQGVNLRRHSSGTIGGKPQVQSRYRENHRVASTHDFCKHGKKCDQHDVVKPWKMVRRKSVESSETVKVETPGAKPQSSVATKRDALAVKKKPCAFVNSESSSVKEDIEMAAPVDGLSVKRSADGTKLKSSVAIKRDSLAVKKKPFASVASESSSVQEDIEMVRFVDGSSVKSNDKARKNKAIQSTLSGSAVVKKVHGLRNDKSSPSMEKISRISDGESSKVCAPKNKEKAKIQKICGEVVKEKTVCVVETSIKGVQSQKQPSSEKKTIRSGHESLSITPKRGSAYHSPDQQIPGKISTGLTKKKDSDSTDLEANPKFEKKIRPKRTGVKVTQAKQLSFKSGKVLEPKPEDSSPKWTKFRKRVVQELKTHTDGVKKSLKHNRLDVEKSDACEGSKREKVVLRHQKVEGKKQKTTLFNSVIEETLNKFTKMRKEKVKALIGAFETVISLQDTKTSQKSRSKATTSASKVSPLGSQQ